MSHSSRSHLNVATLIFLTTVAPVALVKGCVGLFLHHLHAYTPEQFNKAYNNLPDDESGVVVIHCPSQRHYYVAHAKNMWHQTYTLIEGYGRPRIFHDIYKNLGVKIYFIPCSYAMSKLYQKLFQIYFFPQQAY